MLEQIRGKKIVIFGTGNGSETITRLLLERKVSPAYYVDNNAAKWGTKFNGIKVVDPASLLQEPRDNFVILVASSFYPEIATQLTDMNFVEDINFINALGALQEAATKDRRRQQREEQIRQTQTLLHINTGFKNINKNNRCFIIGNGPSINEQDLTLLQDEVKIAVNFFYHHPQINKIRPQYWFIADPKFWNTPENTLYPLLDALAAMTWKPSLFLPIDANGRLSQEPRGLNVSHYYYQYDYQYDTNDAIEIDFSRTIPPFGQNVVLPALMFAIYMGCSSIYLLGCDHTWWGFSKENYIKDSLQCEQARYFYSGQNHQKLDAYHEAFTYDRLYETIVTQKAQYRAIKRYCDNIGITIRNATAGGFLDEFPRADYNSLFRS